MLPEDPRPFWPITLNEWLAVFALLAGAVAAVWKFVRQPIMDRVNDVGSRLNVHINDSKILEGRISGVERGTEMAALDRTNIHEAIGRITVQVETLTRVVQESALTRVEDLSEIRERLVRIETKLTAGFRDQREEHER